MAVRPLEYISSQVPVLQGQPWMMSRPWYMWMMGILTTLSEAGDVVGPAISTNNAIVRWDGTTGKIIQNSVVPLADDGTFSFPDGIRQTFNPNEMNAGVNVGAQAGNPSSLINGDVWYNSALNKLYARINGVTVEIGANSGQDFVVMSDGANPPTPMNDGNGNFIYVPYTP